MSEPINLEKTKNSPEIILDKGASIFKIAGRSIVEDPKDFYTPIYNWIEDYIKAHLKATNFVFDF